MDTLETSLFKKLFFDWLAPRQSKISKHKRGWLASLLENVSKLFDYKYRASSSLTRRFSHELENNLQLMRLKNKLANCTAM
jgi:hypothetical protein